MGALQKSSKLVAQILDENWATLGAMPDGKKAMDILAQKANAQIQSIVADFLPSTELPTTNSGASPGNQHNVTPVKTEEAPLDFIAQANAQYRL